MSQKENVGIQHCLSLDPKILAQSASLHLSVFILSFLNFFSFFGGGFLYLLVLNLLYIHNVQGFSYTEWEDLGKGSHHPEVEVCLRITF